LVVSQGCSTLSKIKETIPQQCAESDACCQENIVKKFFNETDKGWEQEKSYMDDKPLELGIAISGGGTRSASFSMGVLKALNETGVLENVDVISGVSGGAYTTYWYFMQQYYQKQSKGNSNDFFRRSYDAQMTNLDSLNESRYQYTLENSSDILSFKKQPGIINSIKNSLTLTGQLSLHALSVPVHVTTNLLWDWDWNIAPFQYFYRHGLERTYGFAPIDYTLNNFVNEPDGRIFGIPNTAAKPITLAEMGVFLEQVKANDNSRKKLPYFIINTTGRHGQYYRDKRYIDEIFEFTPWSCGSDLFGYVQYNSLGATCADEVTFSKATAVSGAAVDGQYYSLDTEGQLSEPFAWSLGHNIVASLMEVLNLDLGIYIDNYKFLNNNRYAKLHDWGHKILPFPFHKVHDKFLAGNKVNDNDSTSIFLSDGGHSENLGLLSLLKRKVKQIIVIDGSQDIKSLFSAAKYIKHIVSQVGHSFKLTHINNKPINVYDATPNEAVLTGEVIYSDYQRSKIIYIKLSAKTSKTSPFPYAHSIENYMNNHPVFPHESTADVFYSSEQFRAYRDLGYEIGSRVRYNSTSKIYIQPSIGCITCDGKI